MLPFFGFLLDADDDHRKRVDRFFQVPMLVLALLVLPLLAAHCYFTYHLEHAGLVSMVDIAFAAISAVFLVEFVVKVTIAQSRLRYCLTNWLDIVIIVLPFLRPLRVAKAARVVQLSRAYSFRGVYMKVVRTGAAFLLGTEYARRLRERQARANQRAQAAPDYSQWSRAALISEIQRLKERLEAAERPDRGRRETSPESGKK